MANANKESDLCLCTFNPGVNCDAALLCDYCGWNPAVSKPRKVLIRAARHEFLIMEAERKSAKERAKRKLQEANLDAMRKSAQIA